MHAAPDPLVITVETRMELDAALNEAVDILKPEAVAQQTGILVTRFAPGHYEARLNGNVPAGMTVEKWGCELP